MSSNRDEENMVAEPETPKRNLSLCEMVEHMLRTWLYMFKVKLWLACWLVLLFSAVLLIPIAFLFEDLGIGLAALIAGVGICAVNLPMYMRAHGFNKLMSAGHLPFLIPLYIYWTVRLANGLDLSATVWVVLFYYMYVCLGICLVFDIYDTHQWFCLKNHEKISYEDAPTKN